MAIALNVKWCLQSRLPPAHRPSARRSNVAVRASSLSSLQLSQSSEPAGISLLKTAEKIDRVRYQAKVVFKHFDADADGVLNKKELSNLLDYVRAKFGNQLCDTEELEKTCSALESGSEQGETGFFPVVAFVRSLLQLAERNGEFVTTQLSTLQLSTALRTSCLTRSELSQVLCIFCLLDTDNDGRVSLESLLEVGGIEAKIADDVLDDADSDEDGFINFPEFLTSYAKARPVILSFFVMAAHTALLWSLFSSPLDFVVKALVTALVVLKPQIVTNPVVKVYNILKAIYDRVRAEVALSSQK